MVDRLIRIDQAAEIIGRKPRTVRRLIMEGKLTGHRLTEKGPGLRVVASSVDAFVKRYRINADDWNK